MLLEKATGANSIVQDKYVTVSVSKKNIEEARNYFARVGADLIAHFSRLGSRCVELEAEEKLRIFHDFYRTGEETAFRFDISQTMRKGHDFKDFICPDTFEFEKDCFRMGDRYGRVIFLREYAAYIKDSMVAELCELNRNMMLSVDIIPVPTDEAVREVDCSAWKPISRIGSESKTRTTIFLPLYRMTWSSSEKKARSSLMTLRPVTRE